jgi:hypothetical protein
MLHPRSENSAAAGVPLLRSIMPEKHDSATNAVLGRRKNRSDDAEVIEKLIKTKGTM